MQVSRPNEHGVLPECRRDTLALRGRSHGTITIALCEDGLFRYGLDMMHSHGGFTSPISIHGEAFDAEAAAKAAATEELLRRWPRPFPSEPASLHDELADLREQIESRVRQPSLF